jgi:Uma2 family endonuclease
MSAVLNETDLSEEAIFRSPPQISRRGTPTWEMAYFFPHQGQWTEAEYLALDTNWIVEFTDGCVAVLPMPTVAHQRMTRYAVRQLEDYGASLGTGEVFHAPLPLWLTEGKYREPDVIYQKVKRLSPDQKHLLGADLLMEIVSEDPRDRHRDLVTKREEYADAKVPEYWIIDPRERRVTILRLIDGRYVVHGEFVPGQIADSVVLPGFTIDVSRLFSLGE